MRTLLHRLTCAAWIAGITAAAAVSSPLRAADLDAARKAYDRGDYNACIEAIQDAPVVGASSEDFMELRARSQIALGNYEDAFQTVLSTLRRNRRGIRLPLLGYEALAHFAHPMMARDFLISAANGYELQEDSPVEDYVAMAAVQQILQADPRSILENILDRATTRYPDSPLPALATGELALEKDDYALAADTFRKALRKFPEDAGLNFGMARALAPTDPKGSDAHLQITLKQNPRHLPALAFQAEHFIDADQPDKAEETLAKILEVNRRHEAAWALKAVVAHLAGNDAGEQEFRAKALEHWPNNPDPDYLIGRKLGQNYRFAEAIAYQKKALAADPEHLGAHLELGTTLLRYGAEADGWTHIEFVRDHDPYNIAAYNLLELRDRTAGFTTIERDGIRLRMAPSEAAVFGERAMRILTDAKATLAAKYGVTVPDPVIVEIFQRQQDFAVRTFDMPGGEGFLGVCFGPLITACSPAARLGRSNWEAVLWHEFAHTVTLTQTRNRIPRWLSEGISVYEERQRNPAWGQPLTPASRAAILAGKVPSLEKMDDAFRTNDPSFAYYYSSLVVEAIVQQYGFDKLRAILSDLQKGKPISAALIGALGPNDAAAKKIAAYARSIAEKAGPKLDWSDLTPEDRVALAKSPEEWLAAHPDHYAGMMFHAHRLIDERRWAEARPILERLTTLYPDNREEDNPHTLLAIAYRNLNEPALEKTALERSASLTASSLYPFQRLSEIASAENDSASAAHYADAALAIDPFNPSSLRRIAQTSAAGDTPRIDAYHALLALDPANPGELHYELAQLLFSNKDASAKRHVLLALEQAPRYRAAQKLLLAMQSGEKPAQSKPIAPEVP